MVWLNCLHILRCSDYIENSHSIGPHVAYFFVRESSEEDTRDRMPFLSYFVFLYCFQSPQSSLRPRISGMRVREIMKLLILWVQRLSKGAHPYFMRARDVVPSRSNIGPSPGYANAHRWSKMIWGGYPWNTCLQGHRSSTPCVYQVIVCSPTNGMRGTKGSARTESR